MGRLPFFHKMITAVRYGRLQLLLRESEWKRAGRFLFFWREGGGEGGCWWNVLGPYGLV